jgi:hypothetical protein
LVRAIWAVDALVFTAFIIHGITVVIENGKGISVFDKQGINVGKAWSGESAAYVGMCDQWAPV